MDERDQEYEPPKQLNMLGVFLVVFFVCIAGLPIVIVATWLIAGTLFWLCG